MTCDRHHRLQLFSRPKALEIDGWAASQTLNPKSTIIQAVLNIENRSDVFTNDWFESSCHLLDFLLEASQREFEMHDPERSQRDSHI